MKMSSVSDLSLPDEPPMSPGSSVSTRLQVGGSSWSFNTHRLKITKNSA